jgi:poly(3-hydroxybutyrate) depolymerase
MSNGGGFTNLLARTPSVAQYVAAFAAGSAALYPGTLPGIPIGPPALPVPASGSVTESTGVQTAISNPETVRGVPFLETHGTADHVIPYGGQNANKEGDKAYRLPDIQAWRAAWALRNGVVPRSSPSSDLVETLPVLGPGIELPPPTSVTTPFPKTTLYTWKCVGGADILGYTIEGMGHTWVTDPPESFNATTDVILPFFEQHPLPN